jgi:hypothetical protein
MNVNHLNGSATGNMEHMEQALHASEISCRQLIEAAQDDGMGAVKQRGISGAEINENAAEYRQGKIRPSNHSRRGRWP